MGTLLQAGRIQEAQAPHLADVPEMEVQSAIDCYTPSRFRTRTHSAHSEEDNMTHTESHMTQHVKTLFQRPSNTCSLDLPVLQVHRIMDKAPHLLLEDMPVARFYNIFTKTGCHSAIVVSTDGSFVGMLTRECLISSTRDAHRPPDARRAFTSTKSCESISSKGSKGNPRSRNASTSSSDMCACGNMFMEDSIFCRKCGAERFAAAESQSRDQIDTRLARAEQSNGSSNSEPGTFEIKNKSETGHRVFFSL